jgi:hypothetical protein
MSGANIENLVFIGTSVMYGGVGADIMIGGTGRDVLTSNAGIDRFNYNNVNEVSVFNFKVHSLLIVKLQSMPRLSVLLTFK